MSGQLLGPAGGFDQGYGESNNFNAVLQCARHVAPRDCNELLAGFCQITDLEQGLLLLASLLPLLAEDVLHRLLDVGHPRVLALALAATASKVSMYRLREFISYVLSVAAVHSCAHGYGSSQAQHN